MSESDRISFNGAAVERLAVHRIATELADEAWGDANCVAEHPLLEHVAAQMIRAIGSITANIAEGYARFSRRDRIRYYEYALGSAEEARSWYTVARRVLPAADVEARLQQLTSIRRLLLTMIRNERAGEGWKAPGPREDQRKK